MTSKGLVASAASMVLGVVSGLLTILDPAFLIAHPDLALSLGFSIFRGGSIVAPGLPWEKVMLVLVAAAIAVTLNKVRRTRNEEMEQ